MDGSGPAIAGGWKKGGGSGAAVVGKVRLNGTYSVGIGYKGNKYYSVVYHPHAGGDTYINGSNTIVNAGGGKGRRRRWWRSWNIY